MSAEHPSELTLMRLAADEREDLAEARIHVKACETCRLQLEELLAEAEAWRTERGPAALPLDAPPAEPPRTKRAPPRRRAAVWLTGAALAAAAAAALWIRPRPAVQLKGAEAPITVLGPDGGSVREGEAPAGTVLRPRVSCPDGCRVRAWSRTEGRERELLPGGPWVLPPGASSTVLGLQIVLDEAPASERLEFELCGGSQPCPQFEFRLR